MMADGGDVFTEVTSTSWFSRIGNAFKGILIGFVLIAVSGVLLFWNEGRTIRKARELSEGEKTVVSVAPDKVDPANNQKLVYFSAAAASEGRPEDSVFGVAADALVLARNVQMYEWKETERSHTEKRLGGGTTTVTEYSYDRVWDNSRHDSATFKQKEGHENPPEMRYTSQNWAAPKVTLGAFTLSSDLTGHIAADEPLALTPEMGATAAAKIAGTHVQAYDGGLYVGADPANPAVGDLKITYKIARSGPYSVVAQQASSSLETYVTRDGGKLSILKPGTQPVAALFAAERQSNRTLAWILRAVGVFLMWLGWVLVMQPLSVLADVIPFLGSLVGAGTAFVSFLLTLVGAPAVIAVGWIAYRPLIGIPLVVLSVLGIVSLVRASMLRSSAVAVPRPE